MPLDKEDDFQPIEIFLGILEFMENGRGEIW
jgi:hypothetical protein